MKSQEIRKLAPEMDPLRLGMGWTVEDLEKPQILIESTYGQSHPGSAHLLELAQKAYAGVGENGGKGALYFATDICDGMAQGHDGINYSLASRDTIANLIEIHANATTFDAGVFLASCDKSVPAQLMAIGRIDIPSIVVTGGVMDAGPDLLTLEQIGAYSAMFQRGEITEEQFLFYKHHACPSCGACSFMGTASTMQIMAEALGLMLPGSALMPATCADLREVARRAGQQAVQKKEKMIVYKGSLQPSVLSESPAAYEGNLWKRLSQSRFRSSFSLKANDRYYVSEKGMDTIRSHAKDFVEKRLAPARPHNDGKQTPMRGHPVFIAQHATGTCCRGCLEKWHHIPQGREMTESEQAYVVDVIMEWIHRQMNLS